jgi:hypothetical protein
MQPYQPDPAVYYPPSQAPSPFQSPPPPHQAYQPGTYGQQPYQQQPYQQPATPPYLQPATPPYLQTSPEARDALKSKGTRDIVFGAVWLAVGLGITVVTFAVMKGAAMIVAWGPALYGIYKIVKGLITVSRTG